MARKTIIRKEGAPSGAWMVTFSDMCTLLLTFFVLLFSMSSLRSEGFVEFFKAFSGDSLGLFQSGAVITSGEMIVNPIPEIPSDPVRSSIGLLFEGELEETAGSGPPDAVEATISDAPDGAVTFILVESVLFQSSSAEINPGAAGYLNRMKNFLAEILSHTDRRITIEGHTDNSIPTEEGFALSAQRAVAVLNALLQDTTLPPGRFSVVGYGPTRPRVSNDTEEGRAKNRRVSIVVEPPDRSIFLTETM